MNQAVIESGMEMLTTLEGVEKAGRRTMPQDLFDELRTLISGLRDALKEAVWQNAVTEYQTRPRQAPASDTMLREIEQLAETLKNPTKRDGVDITGTLDQIASDFRRRK